MLGVSTFAAFGAPMCGVANAQDANVTKAPDARSEVVIVTARKRSESVQNVPISIRAIGEKELHRLGADSIEGFAGQAPGLSLSGNRATAQMVVRGVSTGPVNHDQAEIKETVGLYLDESPIAVQRFAPNLKLYDISRVEVLRGPQGTLYGAGSMAGTVRLITNKPNSQKFEASVKGLLSSIDQGGISNGLDAMVNIPLVEDKLAIRAVGSLKHNAGFIDNVVTKQNDVNAEVSSSGRVALRYTPDALTTIDALVSAQKSNFKANTIYAQEAGYLKANVYQNEPYLDKNILSSLTLNHSFDAMDLTAVGTYRNKKLNYLIEAGTFPNFVTGFRDGLGGILVNNANQKDYTGEMRLSSKSSATIQWTIGGFYQSGTNFYGQDLTVKGVDKAGGFDSRSFGANVDQLYLSAIQLKEKQAALFGEAVFPISPKLKATLGGRLFDSKQESAVDFEGIFADPNEGKAKSSNHEKGFNPKVNVTYEVAKDHMIYAQASKGFRLGGINEPVPLPSCQADLTSRGMSTAPKTYKSDSLWNYELGSKNRFDDLGLTVNASAYKIQWRNPQVTAQLGCGFNVFVNAGGLDITGTELEIIARPLAGLTLRGGLGYTDSKLTQDLVFVSGHKGDNSPYVPKWSFSGSIDYTRPISPTLEGFAFLSVQNTGDRNTRFNTALTSNYVLPSYTMVNGRLGINASKWSVELFVENMGNTHAITDKKYYPYSLIASTQMYPVTPRTIGLEASMRF